MPRLTAAFLIITLASIGLPGLNGFVGEFLILLGAFRWDPRFVVGAGLGVILSAVYMLWMFQRVYYGPVTHEENATLPDLRPREWAARAAALRDGARDGRLPDAVPQADGAVGAQAGRAGAGYAAAGAGVDASATIRTPNGRRTRWC